MNEATPLVDWLLSQVKHDRFILGLVGPPGAGKSTLAAQLFAEIEAQRPGLAVVVPMDGYHLDDSILGPMGLLPLKGVPATFDGAGFVTLLKRIRQANLSAEAAPIYAPKFDRSLEASIAGAIAIRPTHQLVIVEGNYLLLEDEPWHAIKPLCDAIWYIDVPEEVLLPRLIERHVAGGKDSAGAMAKVESTDLPNARLVAATKSRADRVI